MSCRKRLKRLNPKVLPPRNLFLPSPAVLQALGVVGVTPPPHGRRHITFGERCLHLRGVRGPLLRGCICDVQARDTMFGHQNVRDPKTDQP